MLRTTGATFKVSKPNSLSKNEIDKALELPIVKRANKSYLMELVHASKLQENPNVYDINGDDWFSSAIDEALASFRKNKDRDDTTEPTTSVVHAISDDPVDNAVICVNDDDNPYQNVEEKTSEEGTFMLRNIARFSRKPKA